MEWRRFGPTERQVAVVGQGTWDIDCGDRVTAIATLEVFEQLQRQGKILSWGVSNFDVRNPQGFSSRACR